jgi:hypothetical protein
MYFRKLEIVKFLHPIIHVPITNSLKHDLLFTKVRDILFYNQLFFFFFETGAHYIAQAVHEFMIFLLQPLEASAGL